MSLGISNFTHLRPTCGTKMFCHLADYIAITPNATKDDAAEYAMKSLARFVYAIVVQYAFTFLRIFYLGVLYNGACAFIKGSGWVICEILGKREIYKIKKDDLLNQTRAHLYYGIFDFCMNLLPWYIVALPFGVLPHSMEWLEGEVTKKIAVRTSPYSSWGLCW